MQSFAQFHFDFTELGSFPLGYRAPINREPPITSLLATTVREAKKVEGLRFPFSASCSIVGGGAAKLDQTRFLGMQFQFELGEALPTLAETARPQLGAESPPRSHQPNGQR